LAFALRLVLFLAMLARHPDGFFQIDSSGYWQLAGNLLEGHGFSASEEAPRVPEHSRTPGYPVFLAVFRKLGLPPAGVVFAQLLLSSLAAPLTSRLARRLGASAAGGRLAGGLVALDVPSISLANALVSETLFAVLLLGMALVLAGGPGPGFFGAALAGFALGLAILVRPIAALLPAVIWICLAIGRARRARLIALGFFFLGCALPLTPWLARNARVFGRPFLSTIGHHNLLYYRAAGTLAWAEQISLVEAQGRLSRRAAETIPFTPAEDPVSFKRREGALGLRLLAERPALSAWIQATSSLSLLVRPLRSTLDLQLGWAPQGTTLSRWGDPARARRWRRLLESTSPTTLALVGFQLAVAPAVVTLFLIGVIRQARRGSKVGVALVVILVAYFALISGGAEAYARFRAPIVPFLAIGAGWGLEAVGDRWKRLSRTPSC